jgi:hypothetical protein
MANNKYLEGGGTKRDGKEDGREGIRMEGGHMERWRDRKNYTLRWFGRRVRGGGVGLKSTKAFTH